ncbi:superinfection immunity protein [Thermomonospora cellulosilytica]|uniref:Putative membrane protein n=1 Tax=Thermomonospora cellulosilytica TaxID=1411118 RepID=A0A7W3MVU4_9ACTN|nr:superinfection immunity protein [Thermomonospora cellulosilytica]MBA9002840.1 putative membrane protein [Thermomonospora cellulosilytica]
MITYGPAFWFWFLVIVGAIAFAALPTIIAMLRRTGDLTTIIAFNIIGCATLVGWPVALVLACIWPKQAPDDELWM